MLYISYHMLSFKKSVLRDKTGMSYYSMHALLTSFDGVMYLSKMYFRIFFVKSSFLMYKQMHLSPIVLAEFKVVARDR